MENSAFKEVTCELCGRVFKSGRRRYYCERDNHYYHVCGPCQQNLPKCRLCGVKLTKKLEPLKKPARV